jgi:hypothetical protein
MVTSTEGADMVSKRQLLQELQRRIDAARDAADWRMAELYTCTALRIQRTPNLAVAGQTAREVAATDARISLTDRIGR